MSATPMPVRERPDGVRSFSEKKHRRVGQACQECASRRIKCNGQQPCERCGKKNALCLYRTKRKRGPKKGWHLKAKIEKLEKQLEQNPQDEEAMLQLEELREELRQVLEDAGMESDEDGAGSSNQGGDWDGPQEHPESMFSQHLTYQHRGNPLGQHTNGTGGPAFEGLGQQENVLGSSAFAGGPASPLALSSTSGTSRRSPLLPPLADPLPAPPARISPVLSSPRAGPPPAPVPPLLLGPTRTGFLPIFMSPALYQSIVRAFLTAIWPTIPILHPPTLISNPSTYPAHLILAVMALGIKFARDPDLLAQLPAGPAREALADQLFDQAHGLLSPILADYKQSPTAMDVISLVHFELFVGVVSGRVAVAMRWLEMAVGLAREIMLPATDASEGDARWRLEEQRRMLWVLFAMDRGLSFGSSVRHHGLPRERMDHLPLPVPEDVYFGDSGPVGSAVLQTPTLAMFMADPSHFLLFLSSLGPFAKLMILYNIISLVTDFWRLPPALRTPEARLQIQRFMEAFYDALPPTEQAPAVLAFSVSRPHAHIGPAYVLLVFFGVATMLHARAGMTEMFEDQDWVGGDGFIKAVEAAGMVTALLDALSRESLELIPLYCMFPLMRTTQIYMLLVKKLQGEQAEPIRRDMRSKVDSHISAFRALAPRVAFANLTAQMLQLLLQRTEDRAAGRPMAGFAQLAGTVPLALGFGSWDALVARAEQMFGKDGFFCDLMRFVRKELEE
ncbi:hypothetical protein DFJ74DRAFT_672966 [Hyaloraphidium curvatum]|nr:hypothetical protein DFJ74DRAFT_672966 [Hyaloraphidium curvatum]